MALQDGVYSTSFVQQEISVLYTLCSKPNPTLINGFFLVYCKTNNTFEGIQIQLRFRPCLGTNDMPELVRVGGVDTLASPSVDGGTVSGSSAVEVSDHCSQKY